MASEGNGCLKPCQKFAFILFWMSLSPLVLFLLSSLTESFVLKFASAKCTVSATKRRRKAGRRRHIAPIIFRALKMTVFLRFFGAARKRSLRSAHAARSSAGSFSGADKGGGAGGASKCSQARAREKNGRSSPSTSFQAFFFPASACSLCLHSVFFPLTFSASFFSFFSAHFSVAVSICMFASSPLVPAFYARAVLLFLFVQFLKSILRSWEKENILLIKLHFFFLFSTCFLFPSLQTTTVARPEVASCCCCSSCCCCAWSQTIALCAAHAPRRSCLHSATAPLSVPAASHPPPNGAHSSFHTGAECLRTASGETAAEEVEAAPLDAAAEARASAAPARAKTRTLPPVAVATRSGAAGEPAGAQATAATSPAGSRVQALVQRRSGVRKSHTPEPPPSSDGPAPFSPPAPPPPPRCRRRLLAAVPTASRGGSFSPGAPAYCGLQHSEVTGEAGGEASN